MSNVIQIVPKEIFSTLCRDPLLDYWHYREEAADLLQRIPKAEKRLADPNWLKGRDIAAFLRMTQARAQYALDLVSISYSAGSDVEVLSKFFPALLIYYEEFALYSDAYNESPAGRKTPAPHFAIRDFDFERVNQLICFAILLGWQKFMPRIMAMIDYRNPLRDGMLERTVSRYISRSEALPSECCRHLPYYKTLAVFDAPPASRPELMRDYLEDWYKASRREPYYGMHTEPRFLGYWAWESAAITVTLGIDDSQYRDLKFYPRDMVDFFRRNSVAQSMVVGPAVSELRAKAGEACPAAGLWESVGIPTQRDDYAAGTKMKDLGSPYGLTVWRHLGA